MNVTAGVGSCLVAFDITVEDGSIARSRRRGWGRGGGLQLARCPVTLLGRGESEREGRSARRERRRSGGGAASVHPRAGLGGRGGEDCIDRTKEGKDRPSFRRVFSSTVATRAWPRLVTVATQKSEDADVTSPRQWQFQQFKRSRQQWKNVPCSVLFLLVD
ncbi:hypothetical protein J6590_051554 [Homalodisca vitripennis]|nr:hypothetical protein J6590_051554 [Homalodisca vitripennis]